MPCGLVCRHTRAPSASTWLTACRALPAQVRQAYENALRFDPAHPNALENMHKFFWSQDRQHSQGSQATVPSLPQQGRAASQGSKGAGGAGHGGKRQEAGHAGKTIQDLPPDRVPNAGPTEQSEVWREMSSQHNGHSVLQVRVPFHVVLWLKRRARDLDDPGCG